MQDGERAVFEVTALLGTSSRNALLSMRPGHTVVATYLVICEPYQPAQEVLGPPPQATFQCTWAEVIHRQRIVLSYRRVADILHCWNNML
jgi:hypothetical protein